MQTSLKEILEKALLGKIFAWPGQLARQRVRSISVVVDEGEDRVLLMVGDREDVHGVALSYETPFELEDPCEQNKSLKSK